MTLVINNKIISHILKPMILISLTQPTLQYYKYNSPVISNLMTARTCTIC